ncbi:MAG: hypothetical protein Rhims3KO_06020 [Hyphomicrobiales bacterium]
MDDLPLKIGQRNLIIINDAQFPDTCRGQIHQAGRTKPTSTNDSHMGGLQLGLAGAADFTDDQMPSVSFDFLG